MGNDHSASEVMIVLEGRIVALVDDAVVEVNAGSLPLKPAGVMHAFGNPGPEPARVHELHAPGGLEEFSAAMSLTFADQRVVEDEKREAFLEGCKTFGLLTTWTCRTTFGTVWTCSSGWPAEAPHDVTRRHPPAVTTRRVACTLVGGFAAGADGWLSGLPAAFPRQCRELHDAICDHSDIAKGRELWRRFVPFMEYFMDPARAERAHWLEIFHYAVEYQGVGTGHARRPLQALDDEEKKVLNLLLDTLLGIGLRDPGSVAVAHALTEVLMHIESSGSRVDAAGRA